MSELKRKFNKSALIFQQLSKTLKKLSNNPKSKKKMTSNSSHKTVPTKNNKPMRSKNKY